MLVKLRRQVELDVFEDGSSAEIAFIGVNA
jgi:hypothetical protein